jgi:hypothetical protein
MATAKHLSPIGECLCQAIRNFRAGDHSLLQHLIMACQPHASCTFDTAARGRILIVRSQKLTVGIDAHADMTSVCAQSFMALFGPLWPRIPHARDAWDTLHGEARTEARTRRQQKKEHTNASK